MRALLVLALIAAPAFAAGPAFAQDSTGSGKPAPDPNETVCKREAKPGSRIGGTRVCRTRGEWEQIAQDARRNLNDVQNRGALTNPRGN